VGCVNSSAVQICPVCSEIVFTHPTGLAFITEPEEQREARSNDQVLEGVAPDRRGDAGREPRCRGGDKTENVRGPTTSAWTSSSLAIREFLFELGDLVRGVSSRLGATRGR
jgi:hypothetical protein